MYSTLLYASLRKPECGDGEIHDILNSARKNNSKIDVTGVLLYNRVKFLQYLEGDYFKINQLYKSIKLDQRHENVILLFSKKNAISQRLFPQWAMGGRELDTDDIIFHHLGENTHHKFMNVLKSNEIDGSKAMMLIRRLFHIEVNEPLMA